MCVFDTFLFFNEVELLELRLEVLSDVVDYFIITEATKTFSGKKKPLYYELNKNLYGKFKSKIIHNVIDETPDDFSSFVPPNEYYTNREIGFAHKSRGIPLSKLNIDFQREVYQRDSIINGLLGNVEPDDFVLISDLDEIPCADAVGKIINSYEENRLYNFCQKWFIYYLNLRYEKEWFGTRLCTFSMLKGKSMDLMRYNLEKRSEQPGPIVENGGWHFSFLGGEGRVREKLNAYTYQGRKSKIILKLIDRLYKGRIKKMIEKNKDIFYTGRKFNTVPLDETFPPYILKHKEKYKKFIKNDCN
jgi:beta-1,4-mannosyl-glycoprotein beta-1,4-N-acetylglucosaminyltransferase